MFPSFTARVLCDLPSHFPVPLSQLCEEWGHQHLLLEVTCCVLGFRDWIGLELGFGSWCLCFCSGSGTAGVAGSGFGSSWARVSLLPGAWQLTQKALGRPKARQDVGISPQAGAGSVPLDELWAISCTGTGDPSHLLGWWQAVVSCPGENPPLPAVI